MAKKAELTTPEAKKKSAASKAHRGMELPVHPASQGAQNRLSRLRRLVEPRTEDMMNVLFDIATDENVHPSVRILAVNSALDRAYGKPKETVAIEESAEPAGDEVLGLLNNILKSVGAPTLEAPSSGEEPKGS